ncbi:hypothetical protein [Ktedonobacter robiniae]|uniref:hypothetical protein n=1 Tax=Ktedonobacter robiniae TaxID=2778365 RepID=UPI0019167474|nr:hypothetical protein [Ktedonobacter robiniae]
MARLSNYARLNETPLTTRASFLEGGYSLYDIKDLQQVTDREEVEVRHYGMYLTPEAILYMLAKQHLVFGLSATVDIVRQVHNFDLDWLREKRILLEVDEEEKAIVHALNQEKAKIRANQVHLNVVQSLDLSDPYQAQLDQLLQAVSTDEDFAEVTASEPIKERVRLFFSALLTIQAQRKQQQQPTAPAHALLFFNTFRQMKFIFDRYPGPDHQLFTVKKRDDHRWFEVYDLEMQNEHSIIVFYNAELAKAVRHSEAAQSAFDRLFLGRAVSDSGHPVSLSRQWHQSAVPSHAREHGRGSA